MYNKYLSLFLYFICILVNLDILLFLGPPGLQGVEGRKGRIGKRGPRGKRGKSGKAANRGARGNYNKISFFLVPPLK